MGPKMTRYDTWVLKWSARKTWWDLNWWARQSRRPKMVSGKTWWDLKCSAMIHGPKMVSYRKTRATLKWPTIWIIHEPPTCAEGLNSQHSTRDGIYYYWIQIASFLKDTVKKLNFCVDTFIISQICYQLLLVNTKSLIIKIF